MGLQKRLLHRTIILAHLTEIWRRAVDSKQVVGVAFVDFQKAFDSVRHVTLLQKLEYSFGVTGNMLEWLTDYLRARKQCTVVNGVLSDNADVTFGIPQGSVLGPILFTLYTNNLPKSITSGTVYMYADDITIFCIGQSVDEVTTKLNKALGELQLNTLTPHPTKCEAMILQSRGGGAV
jgi:hypothetical protein